MSVFVLGLTGGIGSGKSAVSELLGRLGACIVDTDLIARALTQPGGAAIEAIRGEFGEAMIAADGALERGAMRRLVFADAAARMRLEGILHPLIRTQAEAALAAAEGPYAVLVVPLLVEGSYWQARCDRVAVVDCREATQVERVMRRSGLSESEVRAIMASQAGRAERAALADTLIDNDGAFDALPPQVEALHRRCIREAEQKRTGAVL